LEQQIQERYDQISRLLQEEALTDKRMSSLQQDNEKQRTVAGLQQQLTDDKIEVNSDKQTQEQLDQLRKHVLGMIALMGVPGCAETTGKDVTSEQPANSVL
jgi:YesN/AraC family two-component response regulator